MLTDVTRAVKRIQSTREKGDFLAKDKERREGHMKDALALGGDEGRDKLRKAAVRGKYPLTRRCPNGATRRGRPRHPAEQEANPGN